MDVSRGNDAGQRRKPVYDSYARLSRMPDTGELEKIETQQADIRTVIERLGGALGEELSDGLSAWKRGVVRKGWETLLERVRSGMSDGIVVWHTDRLFRQPRDLETLIELADKGFRVSSAHGSRDLSDPDDRFILRIEVAHAARSSDDTSRRIKRRFQAQRVNGAGHVGGPRKFGWPGKDATWTPGPGETKADRPDVPAELVEREREALRQGTDDVLAEVVGQGTIAARWNAEGLLTAAGREWVAVTVRAVLLRPTNAGLVEHDGALVAQMPGEPIVDPDKFARLRSLFASRRRGRAVGQRYVGTGIMRCKLCDTPLSAHPAGSVYSDTGELRYAYFCNKQRRGCGKVSVDGRAIEEELRTVTILRLSDREHAAGIERARARVADRLAQVRTEIAQCREIQEGLSVRLGRREMSLAAFDAANGPLVADLARLEAEDHTLSGGNLDGPAEPQSAAQVAADYDAADIAERRRMLRSALSPDTLLIARGTRTGKRVFDRGRLWLRDPDGTERQLS
jgi:site-specific DNA recombinase